MGRDERKRRVRSLSVLVMDLCGITALLVAAIFAIMLVSVEHLRNDDTVARGATDLLTQSATVEDSVVDLETGIRGYLPTGDPVVLQPYYQAKARLPSLLKTLASLTDSRLEQQKVSMLEASIMNYETGYAPRIIATKGRLTPRQALAATLQGKRLDDTLRAEFTALSSEVLAERARERAGASSQTSRTVVAGAIGLALSVLLLGFVAVYLVRRIIGPMRTVAEAANDLASGQLETRVPELGLGEVAQMASSFNAMAERLQARDEELSHTHDELRAAVREAHEASALKSNFLANMSHEIRTPLNGLVGTMELLSETELTGEQQDYVSVAKSSGDALMTVVNDVLDIAKIEAGRLELEHRDFDLHDLVEDCCDMVAATAALKGLELQSFVHDDVPHAVNGDRVRVGQILTNLLSNAVKFTTEGEVVVEVCAADRVNSQAKLQFDVLDTGIGLDAENRERLFEPFTQADTGTTRTYGGTGLGLAIAQELTRMMGGTISVDSELGKGSRFRVLVPFPVSTIELPAPLEKEELTGLHVLVVDDNTTNRRIFEAYVTSWGMRPVPAANARSAMSKLKWAADHGDPIDIALLDHNMPNRSGLELAQEIADSSLLKKTRMILLSSSGQTVPVAPDSPIHYALSKPVRQSRLLDAIGMVMAGHLGRPGVAAEGGPGLQAFNGRGGRILVAEDQPVNFMLVERLLEKRGLSAVNAINGEDVMQKLALESFDLVLMDCQMPILDGYETTRQIRQAERAGGGRRIPIVAMTAHAMQGDRERCLDAGMDDYLAKPITVAAIDAVLRRWLLREEEVRPTLDPARMDELRSLFPGEETSEVIIKLQAEVAAQLERAEQALDRGDGREASEAGHRIAGSAHMVGAQALAEAARSLQAVALVDLVDAAAAIRTLKERWKVVSAALQSELPNA